MKLIPVILLLSLILIGTASAAAAPAFQPVRTAPVVTTTTTPAPALTIAQVVVAVTTTPVYVTCTPPAVCISEQDAIEKWGQNRYVRDSDQSCGTGSQAVTRGSPVLMYCYREVQQTSGKTAQDAYLENSRFALDQPPADTAIPTNTPLVTIPATPLPTTTTLSAAGSPVQQAVAIANVPAVTTTTASAKPATIVDAIFTFFASLFGGGKSGNSPPP